MLRTRTRRASILVTLCTTLALMVPAGIAGAGAEPGSTVTFSGRSGSFADDDGTVTVVLDTRTADGLDEERATFTAGPDAPPVPLSAGIAADFLASEPTVDAVVQVSGAGPDEDALAMQVTDLTEDDGVLIMTGTVEDAPAPEVDAPATGVDDQLPASFEDATVTVVDRDVAFDDAGQPVAAAAAFSLPVFVQITLRDLPGKGIDEVTARRVSDSCVDNRTFRGDATERDGADYQKPRDQVFTRIAVLRADDGQRCHAWLTRYLVTIHGLGGVQHVTVQLTTPVPSTTGGDFGCVGLTSPGISCFVGRSRTGVIAHVTVNGKQLGG